MKKHYNFPLSERHESQRGHFAYSLFQEMEKNEDIWLICLDIGYKVFDKHFHYFPERTINPGAAETAGLGLAVGLALQGKIPIVYSITSFVLYRPFEFIRNYLDHESIPVKLVGSGRDQDYLADKFTHFACEAKDVLRIFPNIQTYWPEDKDELPEIVADIIENPKPCFLSLKR